MIKKDNLRIINYLQKQEQKYEEIITNDTHTLILEKNENSEEESQKKIDLVNFRNSEINNKRTCENEYSSSLMNMISNEKSNIKVYEEKIHEMRDKIMKIKLSTKIIELNMKENTKKGNNLTEMTKNLKSEINRMNKMIYMQFNKVGFITQTVNRQTDDVIQEKKSIKDNYMVKEREAILRKDEMRRLIDEAEKSKNIKLNNEIHICKNVLGLDLIKRYLLFYLF